MVRPTAQGLKHYSKPGKADRHPHLADIDEHTIALVLTAGSAGLRAAGKKGMNAAPNRVLLRRMDKFDAVWSAAKAHWEVVTRSTND